MVDLKHLAATVSVFTLTNDISAFLTPNTEDIYFTSSVLASPSVGGALICTPTPSLLISTTLTRMQGFQTLIFTSPVMLFCRAPGFAKICIRMLFDLSTETGLCVV